MKRELKLNKANTSDKETSFLDLNLKVIGSNIHKSVYNKRDDFGFPIVNFHWLSGDVPRLPSYGIYISHLVRFARCCSSVLISILKKLQITSKLLTQGYRYHKLRKTFGKFFRWYSEVLSFGAISFQDYVSRNHSPCLLRWSCLQTSESQRRSQFHLVGLENSETPATSSVWPSDHREDYWSCTWPLFPALYRSFVKRCNLT